MQEKSEKNYLRDLVHFFPLFFWQNFFFVKIKSWYFQHQLDLGFRATSQTFSSFRQNSDYILKCPQKSCNFGVAGKLHTFKCKFHATFFDKTLKKLRAILFTSEDNVNNCMLFAWRKIKVISLPFVGKHFASPSFIVFSGQEQVPRPSFIVSPGHEQWPTPSIKVLPGQLQLPLP